MVEYDPMLAGGFEGQMVEYDPMLAGGFEYQAVVDEDAKFEYDNPLRAKRRRIEQVELSGEGRLAVISVSLGVWGGERTGTTDERM